MSAVCSWCHNILVEPSERSWGIHADCYEEKMDYYWDEQFANSRQFDEEEEGNGPPEYEDDDAPPVDPDEV